MTPRTSAPVTTRAPHGRACHSCSPASTSIRANAANAVGPRPSAFLEDPNIQSEGEMGVRQDHFERASHPREVCSSEMVIEADADPLSGHTHVGFAVQERRDPGRSVTCPARHSDAIRRRVLDAYIRLEAHYRAVLVSARRLGPVPAAWRTRFVSV
jgi:hypothetical protein